MSAEDRYDHRGRLLDGPDDPGEAACTEHGNARDECAECLEAFKAEEAEYRAFRLANPLLGDRPGDFDNLADLPF